MKLALEYMVEGIMIKLLFYLMKVYNISKRIGESMQIEETVIECSGKLMKLSEIIAKYIT